MAVVGRGAEEQAVLELGRQQAQHAAQIAVVAERRGHQVVAFIDDEQIPGQVRRTFRRPAGGQELGENILLPQVVIGGDDAAEGTPGVRVHAKAAVQRVGLGPVHEVERQGELLPHLVAPLETERRRGQDQDALDPPPQEELAQDQTRLDGLAEADVIGDQEIDPGHLKGLQERNELEVLDLNCTVKRAGDRQAVERAAAVRIEEGRGRGPARGPKQSIKVLRRHRVGRNSIRERRGFEEDLSWFKFPEEPFLGRELVVFVVEMDEVESPFLAVKGLDGGDDPPAVAHRGKHSGSGYLRNVCGVHCEKVSVAFIRLLRQLSKDQCLGLRQWGY